ncbi:hypothetical protein I260019D6_12720 [Dorea longicatena]|uniref:hypothetical protein n=1 Tax=Dorea longicatena TaxID=88431 RepID=UPI0036F42EF4
MKKILFCNLDLLVKKFADIDMQIVLKNRNEFLNYINILCKDDNIVCFISRDINKLNLGKAYFDKEGYKDFKYKLRENVKKFVEQNENKNNYFVFIGNKEIDFHLAVNTKSLFIVPTWIPTEEKAAYYGVCVDTPTQFYKFILTLNNNNNWYSELKIDDKSTCISLMDARTYTGSYSLSEKQMLIKFQDILKEGKSRNYYTILMYHFLANMTNTTLFDNIELFGVMPSSNCLVNVDLFRFMEQVRYIKRKRLPQALYGQVPEEQNLLVRHMQKQQMHGGCQVDRTNIGGKLEFESLYINPAFETKIKKLKKEQKFNVVIFDDYMNHGNGFNAVRCLLESLGANKIIFVSMGSFRKQFQKKDYNFKGNLYGTGYTYTLEAQQVLTDFTVNSSAKKEVDQLYDIFNK